ncbi:MAG: DNA-binding protein [Planctomycetaceae bacterium]|nr:MAG: DNA-binding protein [Planctomycetaceae bacterium]
MNARVRTYSPREVATSLGLNLETVQRCLKRGDLTGVRTGRRGHYWHIREADLDLWLASENAKTVLARSLRRWPNSTARRCQLPPTNPDDTAKGK